MTFESPLEAKLDKLVRRHAELTAALADPARQGEFAKLSKEYSDLSPIVESVNALKRARAEMTETAALLDEAGDADMRALAEAEMAALKERLPELEQRVRVLLLPKDEADERNAIVVSVVPDRLLAIRPVSLRQMGFIAHQLGNRHIPAQFEEETMLVQYDRLLEELLGQHGVPYTIEERAVREPFRHIGHSHG